MSKSKKKKLETPRLPERMQRHTQRAHTFADRKKKNSQREARGRSYRDDD